MLKKKFSGYKSKVPQSGEENRVKLNSRTVVQAVSEGPGVAPI